MMLRLSIKNWAATDIGESAPWRLIMPASQLSMALASTHQRVSARSCGRGSFTEDLI